MTAEQWSALAQVLTFAGVVVTAVLTVAQHRWAESSRTRIANEQEAALERRAQELESELERRAGDMWRKQLALEQSLAENTAISTAGAAAAADAVVGADKAYHEANTVNAKIEKLALARLSLDKRPSTQLTELGELSTDTNERVRVIEARSAPANEQ